MEEKVMKDCKVLALCSQKGGVARAVATEPPWHVHQQNSDKVAIIWK